jgi:hypothetical protein
VLHRTQRDLRNLAGRNPNNRGSPGSLRLIEASESQIKANKAGVRMTVGSCNIKRRGTAARLLAVGLSFALCAALSGCGLAAAPCRIVSAGLKIVPLVGHVAAAPTDACAGAIDP